MKKTAIIGILTVLALAASAQAAPIAVTLQNATATYSQSYADTPYGNFYVSYSIDGSNSSGWAVQNSLSAPYCTAETAAYETVSNVGWSSGTAMTFSLLNGASTLNLGKFRLSVTTDDRSTFCDGLQSGGDVTANWTVLTPTSAASDVGTTLTINADGSILASGTNYNGLNTYTVTANTTLTGITGIRLEALEDASLPDSGPGRYGSVGNFVLREFTVTAEQIPEPGALVLLTLGGIGMLIRRRRA